METIIGFLGASSIGYFIGKVFSGAETGVEGLFNSLVFRFGDMQLHLHHWFYSFCILALLFIFMFFEKRKKLMSLSFILIFGFLSGLIIQGIISYDDWYQIIIRVN